MRRLIIGLILAGLLTLATVVPAFAHVGTTSLTPGASSGGATITLWLNSNDCSITTHTDGDGSLQVDVTANDNGDNCVDAASN